jgi:LuxR family transcriptional regulator, maltose regulon positive regulatory protein
MVPFGCAFVVVRVTCPLAVGHGGLAGDPAEVVMAVQAAGQMATSPRRPAGSHGDPILAAKITVPHVPGWALQRPRVTRLITQGMRWCPLTIVTGTLGAGKTMALALWAAEAGPVAWVSVDEYDNRPGVFWSYVVAALRKSGVAIPKALSATVQGRTAEHLFLLPLASALAAQNPPVRLVIDDFHLLTEPRVRGGLDFLLKNAGGGLRLVVASRADSPLPLHRYRLAGELAEIRAGDLAFSGAEAGQVLAQHGCILSADSLECLMRQTEGLAAGIRLAAMSMAAHPDPDQFVKELVTRESALTGYLVEEVFSTQPPEVREILLSTSILEHVNAEIASELAGNEQAGRILANLTQSNAFLQPTGGGWYRYHTLFGQMLRLKLKLEYPDRVASLHRQAARWFERNDRLTDAVRHAGAAGDWQLAAGIVIDAPAINEIIEPRSAPPLADEFMRMPRDQAWPEPQPYLVAAAIALSAGRPESAAAALNAAERIFDRLPAGQQEAARLTAAMIRLGISRRSGDLDAIAEAAAGAEAVAGGAWKGTPPRHAGIRAHALFARGVAELWAARFGEAARVLDAGVHAAAASGEEQIRIDCLGHLALAEALRGQLGRAAEVARQAAAACTGDGQRPQGQRPSPAALAALAWVHLDHQESREARSRLKQVDTALEMSPDKLIGTVACLVAAWDSLAEGHAEAAAQFVARARSGWSVPSWLGQRLGLAESRALAAAGNIEAALAAAKRISCDSSPDAAVTLAHAWAAAGDDDNARRALAPVLAARDGMPERVRLQACLVAARLSYHSGDRARGRRALGHALRLAERQRVRLPFALERGWIEPVLQRDPEWAGAHQSLVTLVMPYTRPPARPDGPDGAAIPAAEPLTERELQVLRHVSSMLTTAEIAGELYISTNTVKSHIKHICYKLAASHRGEAVRRARQLQLI